MCIQVSDLWQAFTKILLMDFLRYFIPASIAFLLFWIVLKKVLTHRFIQKTRPQPSRLWFEFKYSMSTVLIFAAIGTCLHFANRGGYVHIYGKVSEFGWAYLIASPVIMILFHDFYFYWTHRLMHHPAIFRYVHKVHHTSTNPSPWAAYSFHPIEAVIQALVLPIILLVIPVHGVVLLIFLTYMILRNVHGHLGFELFPKGFLKSNWINWHTTTTHHNMHHHHFNCNYGLYFLWWDKWMKTNDPRYEDEFEEVTTRTSKTGSLKSVILLCVIPGTIFSQSPEGRWMTFNESTGAPLSIIHIYKNTETANWEGKIDSVIIQPNQGANPICIGCPGNFKDKPVIGLPFLWGFEKDEDEWFGGHILDPESGNIYNCRIWFSADNLIQVRGYAGPFDLFYRTQTWRRISGKGINGLWETIDDRYNLVKAQVLLIESKNQLSGSIQRLFLLPHEGNYPICTECEGELKDKQIIGMKFMSGFEFNDGEWTSGSILDPANGVTYSAKFWLKNDYTLIIRGYWGPLFRTQEWKRVRVHN